jgi:glutamine cyclotransferase
MQKVALVAVLVVAAMLISSIAAFAWINTWQIPKSTSSPTLYTYSIIKTYPHDTNAFTEGLVFNNGVLYESTGLLGVSSVRRVDLESGEVLQEYLLPDQYFGEGLTVDNDSLVQLTWLNKVGFVYDKDTFSLLGNFSYSSEGWGLTNNGTALIMSDGTSKITFLDPNTFQKVGEINVHDGNTTISNINELEYIKGDIYANIWMTQKIAIINPQTGSIKGWIDLTGIYQANATDDVLNGIAYDSDNGKLFVTGKDWPNLYQIQITPEK